MTRSRFVVEQVHVGEVLPIWSSSPHASVFTHPHVATALGGTVHWWAARKGREIFVIWPVALDSRARPWLPPFSYYFGPFWSSTAVERAVSSVFPDRLDAYEQLTSALLEAYGAIRAELHPGLLDVRAFSWWNYHAPDRPRFRIDPRFSAVLPIQGMSPPETVLGGLRPVRRREILRLCGTGEYVLIDKVPGGRVIELYESVLKRQDVIVERETRVGLETILDLVGRGFGHIRVAQARSSGEIVAVTVTLDDQATSHLVLNVTDPRARARGVGSWVVFQAIVDSQRRGVASFDFNGANSPRRGDDKHSFGAKEVLYFSLQHDESLAGAT